MLRPALALAALLVALPASAQIYSWTDKDGRTHYADRPPASGPVKVLRGPQLVEQQAAARITADAVDEAATEQAAPQSRLEALRERREAAATAEREALAAAEQQAERERFCQSAGNQLRALQSGQRIARMNAAGEREFISDAERSQEIERLQGQLEAANCH